MFNASLVRSLPMDAMVAHVSQWLGPQSKKDPRITGLVKSETERHEPKREGAARHMEAVAQYESTPIADVPTWIIRGSEDTVSPESAAESARQLTNGKVITIKHGHYFTWENLDGIVDALRSVFEG